MHYSDDPDLELESMDETSSYSDSPLIVPTETQPKWWPQPPDRIRSPRHLLLLLPRWQHHITAAWSAARTRPRNSWKYILTVAVVLYAIVCLARGVPLLASPLPAYTGPYDVGAIDVEMPLETPRRVSDTVFKSTGEPAFELRTTLFTVYYPVARGIRETKPRHPWIARPVSLTAEGYAKFAHVNNLVVRSIFTFALWAIAGSISIPAKVDAPLLGVDDKASSSSSSSSGSERFPVMVFSHGMASSRSDYTNYVGELASRGYIVAAIEHRDGSCPGSLMKLNNGQPDKKIIHFRESDLLSDPPMDTPQLKQEQLAFRDAEILETIQILQAINAGQGAHISALNTRSEGTSLAAWAHRLDLDKLTIGGHSYGATGALQALRGAPSPSNPAIGGVILDPGKSSGPLNDDIAVPILVVHSNSWSRQHSIFFGRPHFDAVRDLVRRVLHRPGASASWFLTSLGTSHPSVSDAPLIEPLLLSFTTGASLNVKQALQEYVNVSVEFYEILRNGEIRGLLAEEVTHEEYGVWVSKEREKEFPKDKAKLWEIHVSPVSDK